jgi:hypothetical protein
MSAIAAFNQFPGRHRYLRFANCFAPNFTLRCYAHTFGECLLSKILKSYARSSLRRSPPSKSSAHCYEEGPFRGAKFCQRTFADSQVNRKRRECPSRRFSLDATSSRFSGYTRTLPRCLRFSVQFRGAEETAPVASACWRFGPKLSVSLVNRDLRVNNLIPSVQRKRHENCQMGRSA